MMIRLVWMIKRAEWKNWTVAKMFGETCKKLPQKPMLVFEDEVWTFQQVDQYSNQVAHFFDQNGFQKGDVVSIFMENRPEFVVIW